MRKVLSLILCLLLISGMFAGCSEEETPETANSPAPQEAAAPTEIPETTEVPETEAADPESSLNTAVLLAGEDAPFIEYVLMAVSQDAPFIAQDVALNEAGADALIQWLMTEQSRTLLENFGAEDFGEVLFSLPGEETLYTDTVTRASGTVRLAVDSFLADSGLLEELIPAFEDASGCTVEILENSSVLSVLTARSGYADVVLVESCSLAQSLAEDGYLRTVSGFQEDLLPLIRLPLLLCGPANDPAGAAECDNFPQAFAAIAEGEYTFVSRGDSSTVHTLEKQLWPKELEFGSWYIRAEMEMGPCLVLNGMQGGYILTDKLTWLLYFTAEGIL